MLDRQITNVVNTWFNNKISEKEMFKQIDELYKFWRKNKMPNVELKVKRLLPRVSLPRYESEGAACFDLRGYIDLSRDERLEETLPKETLTKDSPVVMTTGLAFEVPKGYVMLIFSRSGHGFKDQIQLANCVGVIDSDYRGEVKVCLTKTTDGYKEFEDGDRVAQAMLLPIPQANFVEVNQLSSTERGDKGFGSTGIK